MSGDDPLPIGRELSRQELDQRFSPREFRPSANPGFGTSVFVPRDWVEDEVEQPSPVSPHQFSLLGAVHAPPGRDAAPVVFTVQAVGLRREMRAATVVGSHVRAQGLELIAMRELSLTQADALVRQELQGEPFLIRLFIRIDGDRAFMLNGVAHERDYRRHATTFGVMVASFHILEPSERRTIEARRSAVLLDRLAFDFPAAWRGLYAPDATDRHIAYDLLHKDPKGNFAGFIRIELEVDPPPGRSVEEEILHVVAHAKARNLSVDAEAKVLEVSSGSVPIRPRAMQIHRAAIPNNPVPHELWITLLEMERAAISVWMITPGRDGSFDHWAVSERAYRIVLETLRPHVAA